MTREEMIEILEEKKELIEDNNFEHFYIAINIDDNLTPFEISRFTDLFLKSGINPLFYMENIPINFAYDLNINSIEIPNNIKIIHQSAFEKTHNLKEIFLPNNIEEIGDWAFYNCVNLKDLYIPKSVKYIGVGMINLCYNIEHIYYEGSKEDWENIDIQTNNEFLDPDLIVYNTKRK